MSQQTGNASSIRVRMLATAVLAISAILLAGCSKAESDRANSLELSFRAALLGSGLVEAFKNTGASSLEVAAIFSSPATGLRREANLVVAPNGVNEIGHVEGWPFARGQHIKLTNNQYRPVEYDVPGT